MILFTYIILISGLKYNIRVKWLERIGVFSYTLYVTHFASIFLLKLVFYKLGLHFYDIYIMYGWYLGIIVAVALAQLLYYVAEHPTINYIEKLRFRKNSIAA
jgi:peptidoglycan/LPS O-acetylase OafA/YrhL